MKQLLPKIWLSALLLAGGQAILAQVPALYAPAATRGSAKLQAAYGQYRLLQQNVPALLTHVRQNANAAQRGGAAAPFAVTIPFPDGRDVVFTLRDAELLSPQTAAENPDLHAFKGTSADGYFRLRLTTSAQGMEALVMGKSGEQFYAAPVLSEPGADLLVYDARQVAGVPPLQCGAKELKQALEAAASPLFKTTHGDGFIRTYRLAVAATGEYTAWKGGNQDTAKAGLTAIANGLSEVFEKELGIHFSLVLNNNFIFTDANTDPYSTGDVDGTSLTDNQAVLDNNSYLGSSAYDLGMVITAKGSGGLASTPSACNASSKAMSASGLDPTNFPTGPSGAQFILTVAHETAHQFSASHSFAANTGSCSGNTNGATGWEPGGGSTIMAYTSSCTGLAYQSTNDAYFHTGNLEQMATYMAGTNGNCATKTTNTNSAPTASVSGGTSFTIPVSTPFRLTGVGSQADNDTLTYTFDQANPVGGSGTSSAPAATNTTGPMFRPYPPTTSRTQYFPSLPVLLGTTSGTYEVLPSVARALNFKYTVRDNASYTSTTAGRTANGSVTVNTVACATPFAVTSQNTAGSFTANGSNTMTVSWNTATSCATCTNVNIRFSRDGGRTFPYTLAATTPNDGTETLVVPNLTTNLGRILVECVDNVHFNINSAAQTITSSCAAEGTSFSPATDLYAATAGSAALNQTLTPAYGTQITTPIAGQIASTDPASTLTVYRTSTNACHNFSGNATKYDAYTFVPGTNGAYTFTDGGGVFGLVYNLYDGSYNPSTPCQNFIMSSAVNNGGTTLNSSVTATLSKNKQYVLVISSFSASTPALPANYSISVAGGSIFTATPSPGAGFNYSYVIVSNGTNTIKEVRADGNMTNTTTYPAGTYTIWGVSANSTAAALNTTYQGTSFSAFRTAIQNQSSGMCAALSSNSRRVGITTPTPATLLSFDGRLTGRRRALLYWEAGSEDGLRAFDVERSYDGETYQFAGRVLPGQTLGGAYSFTDDAIAEQASRVFYRLRLVEQSGVATYSGTLRFKLDDVQATFAVAPNPVQHDVLRATVGLAADATYDLTVSDVAGRQLIVQKLALQAGLNTFAVPVGALAPGLYFIQLESGATRVTQRFVKP